MSNENVTSQASAGSSPNPARIFQVANAYQQTAAMRAAIELEVFTAIGAGATTAETIAARTGSSDRGTRILCDFLVILGFLTKSGNAYGLSHEAALFLDKKSSAYLGSMVHFLNSPDVVHAYDHLTEAVRRGGTVMSEEGTVVANNPLWVEFARSMAPLMRMPAQAIAEMTAGKGPCRVLDIAAGHGLFGIEIGKKNPQAEIVALDWAHVLEVAKENARHAGLDGRHHTLPGSAFEVEFGSGFNLVLLTNFLHHFDAATCEKLLRKVHASLAPGGRAVTLEFVPNDDRITPADAASFSMIMLGTTPHGDAYTFNEYERMFANAGFSRSEHHRIPNSPQSIIVSHN